MCLTESYKQVAANLNSILRTVFVALNLFQAKFVLLQIYEAIMDAKQI